MIQKKKVRISPAYSPEGAVSNTVVISSDPTPYVVVVVVVCVRKVVALNTPEKPGARHASARPEFGSDLAASRATWMNFHSIGLACLTKSAKTAK